MRPIGLSMAAGLCGLVAASGNAHATDWRLVLAHPDRYVGDKIELSPAFCGGGGPAGADPGLTQCSVGKGDLFVQSRRVAPTRQGTRMGKECGGLDVFEQSSFCRFKVTLVPKSFGLDSKLDDKKKVLLLDAESLELN